jgi:hypothetical protein
MSKILDSNIHSLFTITNKIIGKLEQFKTDKNSEHLHNARMLLSSAHEPVSVISVYLHNTYIHPDKLKEIKDIFHNFTKVIQIYESHDKPQMFEETMDEIEQEYKKIEQTLQTIPLTFNVSKESQEQMLKSFEEPLEQEPDSEDEVDIENLKLQIQKLRTV